MKVASKKKVINNKLNNKISSNIKSEVNTRYNRVKSAVSSVSNKERKTVSVRELTRNMREIARIVSNEQQEFQVTKNSEPLFIIIPNKKEEVKKKYNIQDVLNLAIKDHLWTKEEMKLDLNTRIDNLLYGQ